MFSHVINSIFCCNYLFISSLFSSLFVLYIITLILFLLRLSFILVKTTRNSYPHVFFVNLLLILYYIVQQSTSYFAIVLPLYIAAAQSIFLLFIFLFNCIRFIYVFLSNSRIKHSLYE